MSSNAEQKDRTLLTFPTCRGWMGIIISNTGLCKVLLPQASQEDIRTEAQSNYTKLILCKDCARPGTLPERIQRYLLGEHVDFPDQLDITEATPFQRKVWDTARSIPYGQTQSYGWIARELRNPQASRAVGQALAINPVPIIVPCHRVISSTGNLGGFSGGLEMKQYLLGIEHQRGV